MIKDKTFVTMSDGKKIALHRFLPSTEEKALVVLSHGMAEYAMRYEPFAQKLCDEGFVFYAHDHRGHGETAGSVKNLGYLADKDGFLRVKEDLLTIVKKLKDDFPGKKVFLFGHSFGSFVSQLFIEENADLINGVILSGTAGPRPATIKSAQIVAKVAEKTEGLKHPSTFLSMCAFGTYNKKIKNPTSFFSWTSSDPKEVEKYDTDDYCGFTPTVSFFKDLFTGLSIIHKKEKLDNIPQDLPIFLFAGTDDPVGNYNKTIKKLIKAYEKRGIKDVSYKFYEGGRHEMLNEYNRDEVATDILAWLKNHL